MPNSKARKIPLKTTRRVCKQHKWEFAFETKQRLEDLMMDFPGAFAPLVDCTLG
ncbi:hypothetical protein FACS1894124_8320 [Spirochaetia bacterium]|nr:hypothetical protein FACS1894124_8320 [Spirochaetia bacterium]